MVAEARREKARVAKRPRLASVGAQSNREEVMFGATFDGKVVRRLMAFVVPYRRRLLFGLAAVLVFTATQLAIPLIVSNTFDYVAGAGDAALTLLRATVAVFVGIILVNFIANVLQEGVVARAGERVLFDLRRAMYRHLQRVSLSFMDRTETGRLMSRLQGDVYALQEFLESSVFAVGDMVLLVGIMAVLVAMDWMLGLLALAVVPTLIIVRMVWLPHARRTFLRAREASSIANGAMAEAINGVRTVQEAGREPVNLDLYHDKAHDNLVAQSRAVMIAQMIIPIVDTLTGMATGIVVVVGGAMVLDRSLDLGVLIAFLIYIQRFFQPIRSVTMQLSIMQRAMAAGQRIFEVMDVPVEIRDRPGAIDLDDCDGSVEFRGVTFGYVPDQPVLSDISFTARPGETVALVGPTGSGKTSITALAHRFYEVWDGKVLVGGHDVRDVSQDSLGRHIGMVLQEPFLFSGTIEENIRYHKPHVTPRAGRTGGPHRRRTRVHHAPAGRLPDRDRAARRQSVARPAAAHQLRARRGGRHQGPRAGRGDGQYRQLHGDADPEGAHQAAGRADRPGDRAPPGHHPRRRPHPGPAGGLHCGARHARRADGPERPVRAAVLHELLVVRRHPGRAHRGGDPGHNVSWSAPAR